MRIDIDGATGEIAVRPPASRAGDYIDLRAEMDLVVGITACSAELCNNGSFKPIDVSVWRARAEPTSTPTGTDSISRRN